MLPYWCAMVSNYEMKLCSPGWESVSLYQTTSSTQREIFTAGETILPTLSHVHCAVSEAGMEQEC